MADVSTKAIFLNSIVTLSDKHCKGIVLNLQKCKKIKKKPFLGFSQHLKRFPEAMQFLLTALTANLAYPMPRPATARKVT